MTEKGDTRINTDGNKLVVIRVRGKWASCLDLWAGDMLKMVCTEFDKLPRTRRVPVLKFPLHPWITHIVCEGSMWWMMSTRMYCYFIPEAFAPKAVKRGTVYSRAELMAARKKAGYDE